MKKLAFLTVLLVASSFVFAQKNELKAKVDERCELISTVFRLAEAKEYMPTEYADFSVFTDSVSKYFEPYKNHELIEYCKICRKKYGVGYDAPMSLAVHLQIVDGKISLIPNVKENSLESPWNRKNLPRFIELLNDFYIETNFHDFFQKQTIKEKVEIAATGYFQKIDMEWFKNFFGEVPKGSFNLVISLSNGGNCYGPKVSYIDNTEDLYSILICGKDTLGNPVFEDNWALELIIHEFCHSFCNPLIMENYPNMKKKAKGFFKIKKGILQEQAYSNPQIMLYEILVRASVIKYFSDHSQIDTKRYFSKEKNNGFMWIEELYNSFDKYEQNREKYPTLRSFMPEIVKIQNELDPKKMEKAQLEMQQKYGPTMSIVNIVNGDQNVDASITQIVVKFDSPMLGVNGATHGKKGDKYLPKVLGSKWNEETKTEWILEVKLEPNKEYSIAFPAKWFLNEDYVSPKNTVYLDFKTK